MNRKRWLLVAILVGCGAGVATMTVGVPGHTFNSSINGSGLVTVDNTTYSQRVERGDYDPETGKYPYIVTALQVPDIPSGTYTATVSIVQVGASGVHGSPNEVIGSCRVVVDAENQTQSTPEWVDGALPPDGDLPPGAP